MYQDHRILSLNSSALNGLFRHANQDSILLQGEKEEVLLFLADSEVGTPEKGLRNFRQRGR